MNKGKITLLISLPRGGKTTFANKWVKQIVFKDDENRLPRVIVSEDDIRLALHGIRYSSSAEPMVFVIGHYMMKALYNRGFHVLVDETNSSETAIRNILKLDPDAEYVLIDTPKEVCIERAHLTNQSDLVPVIERIDAQLGRLKAEGIDNVFRRIRDSL